ncbi:DUF3578 domain-containing protein [Litorivicinus sp.]|nr:DUF3578 domain-containing protein [Litorivicinus sp.]
MNGGPTLSDSLRAVARLQPQYTFKNTPLMKERMTALNNAASTIEKTADLFAALASHNHADIGVEASDGLGNKAEAPWIRIYSKYLSSSAREGFYLVIHFPIDGQSVFITLGCGATRYENGSLRNLLAGDLRKRAGWARTLLAKTAHLKNFPDTLDFGSANARPKAYENATAVAKQFKVGQLKDDIFIGSLRKGLTALDVLYDAQTKGEHLDESIKQLALIEEAIKPSHRSKGRQGFGLNAKERQLIELQGMKVATALLESKGYKVKDVSGDHSFDLLAKDSFEERKIEVKASTSAFLQSVIMTHNEVKLHGDESELTGLILVSGIQLDRELSEAKGGEPELIFDWSPLDWESEAIAFRLSKPG